MPSTHPSPPPEGDAVTIEGSVVRSGPWSRDLTELTADSLHLRGLLADGQTAEARALVHSRSVEEQAALVALDADPEEVLALTGMDSRGRPAYLTQVVDHLPSELLAELTAPGSGRHLKYNAEIIRAMSPATFERAVREVLDPIDNPDLRTQVSWEWLEAVAALGDPGQAAALLRHVDPAAIEDAIMDRLGELNLDETLKIPGPWKASRYQAFSEGFAVDRPGEYVEDADTAEILDALWEAAPELLTQAVVNATKRVYGV